MEENVSTVAEPVLTVSHQISANWTIWLPRIENACPNQMVKKFSAQRGGSLLGRISIHASNSLVNYMHNYTQ